MNLKGKTVLLTGATGGIGPVMTSFGNRTTTDRQIEHQAGKKFFTPQEVATQLISIIQNDAREIEYSLNP